MKHIPWWRIYWTALPLVMIASFMIMRHGFHPIIAIIGNGMAFIIGRATQQSDDKKQQRKAGDGLHH